MKNKHYMPHKGSWGQIILPVILAVAIAGAVTACGGGPTLQEKFEHGVINYGTPSGATNIEYVNDQWYTFEWRGQCFLSMKYWRHAAMTKIDCEN